MKISQDVVKGLAKAARSQGVVEELDGPDGAKIQAYYLEDVTVSFLTGAKPSLYGISFETLGKEFTIISSLDLLISLPKDEDDSDEVFEIEDAGVVEHIETYLRWRTVALEKFNI
jgi:hypothetical protein